MTDLPNLGNLCRDLEPRMSLDCSPSLSAPELDPEVRMAPSSLARPRTVRPAELYPYCCWQSYSNAEAIEGLYIGSSLACTTCCKLVDSLAMTAAYRAYNVSAASGNLEFSKYPHTQKY